jgi:hypothetical protein
MARTRPAADASTELPNLLQLYQASRFVFFGRTQRRGSCCHPAPLVPHSPFTFSPIGNASTPSTVTTPRLTPRFSRPCHVREFGTRGETTPLSPTTRRGLISTSPGRSTLSKYLSASIPTTTLAKHQYGRRVLITWPARVGSKRR